MAVQGFGPNMENVLKGMGNTFLTQAPCLRRPGDSTLEL